MPVTELKTFSISSFLSSMAMANQENAGIPEEISRSDFPSDFVFGVATSAYQVEGARNKGGRGDSIWDVFSHTEGKIMDGSNGDIAVDQYHRYKEDVELIAKLGFCAYRFSISWTRIFPDGFGTKANEEGIAYYNNLINALLEKGIQPFVTLFHWDLPQKLHECIDGWLSDKIVEHFASYARACFAAFGDRVKHWITINEPLQTAVNGYGTGVFAPGRCSDRNWSNVGDSSVEPYLAAHNQLLAHAATVAVYRKEFMDQGGVIGLTVDCEWAEAFSDTLEDKVAANRRIDFQLGWFLDPIYYGDYPATMRTQLEHRLPKFTSKDKELLRDSIDFVGLNHYTTRLITSSGEKSKQENGFYNEQQLERIAEWDGGAIGDKAASEWLYIVPWGLRKVLNYINERYHHPAIYVTENGMDDEENDALSLHEILDDKKRVDYFKGYLASVAASIRDGVNIKGYFAWSFLDNFEWAQGYSKRFGLVYVDYKNQLSRHPKSSALWFSHFLKGEEKNDQNMALD